MSTTELNLPDEGDTADIPEDPVYPEGPVGDLTRQRDAKAADAARARSSAEMFTTQADAADLAVRQLQAAIDALSAT